MENIVVKVVVDGVELAPINMGEGKTSTLYKEDITFFSMGHVHSAEGTHVPYVYLIRLDRAKTKEEL